MAQACYARCEEGHTEHDLLRVRGKRVQLRERRFWNGLGLTFLSLLASGAGAMAGAFRSDMVGGERIYRIRVTVWPRKSADFSAYRNYICLYLEITMARQLSSVPVIANAVQRERYANARNGWLGPRDLPRARFLTISGWLLTTVAGGCSGFFHFFVWEPVVRWLSGGPAHASEFQLRPHRIYRSF